jgi:DNA-directed RNA polymerase specialized sigma24 family protein
MWSTIRSDFYARIPGGAWPDSGHTHPVARRDFDRAEDALTSAVEAALRQWPCDGQPVNPRAWLIRAARNKAVDDVRRAVRA